jgi:hypothetical protein
MALRDTKLMPRKLVRTPAISQPDAEPITQHRPADTGQFRLQVDRQTKASYATFEAAKTAALAIKKGHPNLQVVVHDGVASVNTMIELPSV